MEAITALWLDWLFNREHVIVLELTGHGEEVKEGILGVVLSTGPVTHLTEVVFITMLEHKKDRLGIGFLPVSPRSSSSLSSMTRGFSSSSSMLSPRAPSPSSSSCSEAGGEEEEDDEDVDGEDDDDDDDDEGDKGGGEPLALLALRLVTFSFHSRISLSSK